MSRTADISRSTGETRIELSLALDGGGEGTREVGTEEMTEAVLGAV